MASELSKRWQLARRSAAGTGRHAVGVATRGPGRLIRLARRPPVEVRPIAPWRPFHLPPPTGVRLRARGMVVNGLRVDQVDVRAHQIAIRRGSPIAVRARTIVARARLTETDVNWWLTSAHLPLRLRFTDAGIRARTGLAGVALGSIDVTLALDQGRLRLAPQRVAVLGIHLATAGVPSTPLPLPPFPRSARLTDLVTAPSTVTATFQLPGGRWDVGVNSVRELLKVARSSGVSIGTPPRMRADGGPGGKTPDAVRMVSL